MLLVLTAVRG